MGSQAYHVIFDTTVNDTPTISFHGFMQGPGRIVVATPHKNPIGSDWFEGIDLEETHDRLVFH